MARLPDIPESIYVEDQQKEYERRTGSMWAATEFDINSQNMEMDIPHDIGHPGGLENEIEARRIEEERAAALAEEQRRKQAGDEQYAAYQQALQAHEAQQQQAQTEASNAGIQSPVDFNAELRGLESRPLWSAPDNAASALFPSGVGDTGASGNSDSFLPGDGGVAPTPAPNATTTPYDPNLPSNQIQDPYSPPDPGTITSVDDFDKYATDLDNQTFNNQATPASDPGIWENVKKKAQEIWGDTTSADVDTLASIGGPIAGMQRAGYKAAKGILEGGSIEDNVAIVKDSEAVFNSLLNAYDEQRKNGAAESARGMDELATEEEQRAIGMPNYDPTMTKRTLRQLDPQSMIAPTPEESAARDATKVAGKDVLHAPMEFAGDILSIATGDPGQKVKVKDPYGIMDAVGYSDGVPVGDIMANVLPIKLLDISQYADMASQLIENPAETAGGLAVLGLLGRAAQTPTGRRLALATIGGLAGAIDQYMEQHDITGLGNDNTVGQAANMGLEAAGGFAGGYSVAKTLPLIPRMIQTIAAAPTTKDALRYLDRLATKVTNDAVSSMRVKYPAIADGIIGDEDVALGAVGRATRDSNVPEGWGIVDGGAAVPESPVPPSKDGHWEVFNPVDGKPISTHTTEAEAIAAVEGKPGLDYDFVKAPEPEEVIPGNWQIFDKTNKVIRTFDNQDEAIRYVERFPEEGWMAVPENPGNRTTGLYNATYEQEQRYSRLSDATRVEQQGKRRSWDSGGTPGAFVGGAGGLGSGLAAGYDSLSEDAPLSEKLDRAGKSALAGMVGGAIVGSKAGQMAAVQASKIIAGALRSGKMAGGVFDNHPDSPYRVAVAMLAAARDKADDELVQVPGLVTEFQRMHPEEAFPFEDMTAGEIRKQYGNLDVRRLGRTMKDMLTDYLTGETLGNQRIKEAGADMASVEGITRKVENNTNLPWAQKVGVGGIERNVGMMVQEAKPDGAYPQLHKFVADIADEYGINPPRVFVADSPHINASAFRGTSSLPIITIQRGALQRLNEPEMRGLVLHELSHASGDDTGRGLLQTAKDAVNNLLGRGPEQPEITSGRSLNQSSRRLPWDDVEMAAADALDPDEIPISRANEVVEQSNMFGGPTRTMSPDVTGHATGNPFSANAGRAPRVVDVGMFERAYNWWTSKWTDNLERLQGYQNDIAKEYYKQTGQRLPASMMAAELKRMDASKSAEQMIDEQLKPALTAFRELGFNENRMGTDSAGKPVTGQEMLDKYLAYTQYLDIARHQGNYASTGRVNNTRVFPGGAKAPEIEDWLQKFDADVRTWKPEDRKRFTDATQQVWKLGESILDLKKNAGLIDEEAYKALRAAYPRYVPTAILAHINNDGMVGVGRSLSVTSTGIHALTEKGSDKAALSPLAALVSATYQAHAAAHKNTVFNALLGMWGEAGALQAKLNLHGRRAPGWSNSSDRVNAFADQIQLWKPSMGTDNTLVPVQGFVDGKKIKLAVHAELGDVTKFESPVVIPVLSGLMTAFRASATSRNPIFLTSNAFLDFVNYAIRETARDGGLHFERTTTIPGAAIGAVTGGATAAATAPEGLTDDQWRRRVGSGALAGTSAGAVAGSSRVLGSYAQALTSLLLTPQAVKDIARHEYSGDTARFLSQGGGYAGLTPTSGFRERPTFDPLGNNKFEAAIGGVLEKLGWKPSSPAEQEVRRLQRGMFEINSPADIARLIKDAVLLKPVEAIGERIELAPRVAAMKNAERRLQPGIADAQRNLNRAIGTPGEDAARAALADARLRGRIESTNAGRTVTIDFNKGGSWAKNVNQLVPFFNVGMQALADLPRAMKENPGMYPATALTAALVPMYIAEGNNNRDEQTRKDYDDVPQYLKDEGLVYMLPSEAPVDENGNRHPQFLHIRYRQLAPLAILTREVLQRTIFNKNTQDPRTMGEVAMAMLDSVSPVQATDTTDLAMSLTTPALGTALQLGFNRDTFRQRNIVSKNADERASPLSQMLAKRFGFNEDSEHPSWWEFATRDAFTGYAGMWHGASQIMYGEEAPTPQNIPVLGGLLGRFQKGSIGEGADQAREKVNSTEIHDFSKRYNLDWTPQASDSTISNIPLSRVEYAQYQKALNASTLDVIHQLDNDKEWQSWPVVDKKRVLERWVASEHEKVRKQFMTNSMTEEQYKQRADKAYTKSRSK